MTAHDHRTVVPGCYRCELDNDEGAHAFATTRYVISQEPPCRCGSEDCRTYDLDEVATLPVMQPGDSVRVTMTDDGGFDVVPLCADDFLNTDADDGCLYDRHGERVWSGGGLLVCVDRPGEVTT